jgi:hypothetical protein
MGDGRTAIAAGVAGVIGLALLLFESIRGLTGSSFTTLATVLMYVGLGLVVLAGVSQIFAVFSEAAAPDAELDG